MIRFAEIGKALVLKSKIYKNGMLIVLLNF